MLRIKEVREQKKLSQDEVVSRSGIPKRSYLNYENGQTDVPISKLQNIASVLGVSVSDLLVEEFDQSIANDEQETYQMNTIQDFHRDIKKDIGLLNENLHALSEGTTKNLERIAGGVYETLKGQQKLMRIAEKIDPEKIANATDKLDEFMNKK